MMTMMMKNPVILMGCIFLLASLVTSDNTFGPDKCCFQFVNERLPRARVLSFEYTDKRCAMEGVLFTMLRGKQICADPAMQWVKRIMKVVQNKNATGSVLEGSATAQ